MIGVSGTVLFAWITGRPWIPAPTETEVPTRKRRVGAYITTSVGTQIKSGEFHRQVYHRDNDGARLRCDIIICIIARTDPPRHRCAIFKNRLYAINYTSWSCHGEPAHCIQGDSLDVLTPVFFFLLSSCCFNSTFSSFKSPYTICFPQWFFFFRVTSSILSRGDTKDLLFLTGKPRFHRVMPLGWFFCTKIEIRTIVIVIYLHYILRPY